MNHVLIKSAVVTPRTIPANKDRGAITFRNQQAALMIDGADFPIPFTINLGRDENGNDRPPYAPGQYVVDHKSFKVGEYGDLQFSRDLHLIPLTPAQAADAKGVDFAALGKAKA